MEEKNIKKCLEDEKKKIFLRKFDYIQGSLKMELKEVRNTHQRKDQSVRKTPIITMNPSKTQVVSASCRDFYCR